MNRRGFLKFASMAPVALPVAAASIASGMTTGAATGAVSNVSLSSLRISADMDYGAYFGDIFGSLKKFHWGPYLNRYDADALAFSNGVTRINHVVDTVGRAPSMLEVAVERLSGMAVNTIEKVTTQMVEHDLFDPPADESKSKEAVA